MGNSNLKIKKHLLVILSFFIGLSVVSILLNFSLIAFIQKITSISYKTDYSSSIPSVSKIFQIKDLSSFVINQNLKLLILAIILGFISLALFLTRGIWEKVLSEMFAQHPHPKIRSTTIHKYLHWLMLGLTILVLAFSVTIEFKQKLMVSKAATFTSTRNSQTEFQFANGASGTESSRTNVDITTSTGDVLLAQQTPTTVDNADTASNWISSDTNTLVISPETTDKKEGTGSVKMVASASALGNIGTFATNSAALPAALSGHTAVAITPTFTGGTGVDGTFDLSLGGNAGGCSGSGLSWNTGTSTCTVTIGTKSTFNFTTINIPVGTTLTTDGPYTTVPTNILTLKATGNVTIAGTVELSGKGYSGGSGGGGNGYGPGGGAGTVGGGNQNSGGGGGGFGGSGGASSMGRAGGGTYDTLEPGSGGGGCSWAGVAGGAGGGGIRIISKGDTTISGIINTNGAAGQSGGSNCGGGGGSGGKIWLQAANLTLSGSATANGGSGGAVNGGGGGGGRITLEDSDGIISGNGSIIFTGGGNGSVGVFFKTPPVSVIYALGGNNGSAIQTTVYKATLSNTYDVATFSAASQGQLPQGLYGHTTIASKINNTDYIYVLGGNTSTTSANAQMTVYKAALTDGDVGTFATTNQGQLPVGLYGHTTVTINIGGTNYIYVIGGTTNGTSGNNTVYRATINSSGDVSAFSTASQNQLPIGLFNHSSVVANINGTNYLYILGGTDGTNSQSTVYRATIDSSGNVGAFSAASQGQLPVGLSSLSSFVVTDLLGNNYLYVLGGNNGSDQLTVYKAIIDSSGNIGSFSTASQGQLVQPLSSFSALTVTADHNRYLYVFGGSNGGAPQNTVYRANVSTLTNAATVTKSPTLNLSGKKHLTFWIKSSRAGQIFQLRMGLTDPLENVYNITINSANTWEYKTWDISGIADTGKNAISKVTLKIIDETIPDLTVYLDNLVSASYPSSGTISNLIIDAAATAAWGPLSWTASSPSATSLFFNVRTSDDQASWSTWSADVTTSGTDLQTLSVASSRYLEVKVTLNSTDGVYSPTLSDFTVSYVQNTPPTVATPSATLATDGAGIVTVNYQMSDPEDGLCTDSGICNAYDDGRVNVTLQYSTDSASWSNASTVSQTGMNVISGVITVTSVHQTLTSYTITWNAKTDLGTSVEYVTYYLRIHADDGNATRNITNSSGTSLTIDTQAPTSPSISITASPSVTIDGIKRTNAITVTLNLSVTDNDPSKYMMIKTNDNTFSGGTWESYSATRSAYSLDISSPEKTNTLYVKFKDSFGNESLSASDVIVYDTAAPNIPQSLKIADFSDIPSGDYRLLISWSRVDNPASNDFASYQIYRSTDASTDGSLIQTINNRATSYYVDQNLTKNQRYYYKVKSVDSLGNTSNLSLVISAAPSIGDIALPALASNTTVSVSTTSTTATFTFYTSDVAFGYVDYGVTTPSITVGEVSAVSSQNPHLITITNLSPGTTYAYQVRAKSVVNFEGKTKEAVIDQNKTFTTSSNVTISNTQVLNLATSSATIIWQTSELAGGEVSYGTTSNLGSAQTEILSNNTINHSVFLTGLTPETTYYYRVKSGSSYYPDTSSSPDSFKTLALAKSEERKPVISGKGPTVISLSTSVTVTWTTDKISDSYVEFGLTSSYGTNVGLDESTLSHSVTVTGLTPSTTYHYRVKSKDSDGNMGVSSDSTFTTKDKSVITEVAISDISLTSAILSWTTNVISKSKVKIGTDLNGFAQEAIEESTDKTLNHVARIKNLKEGTKYYLRIIGIDGDGNVITSDDYSFSTISKPLITEVKVKSADDHFALITWHTNVNSDSTVSYGREESKLDVDKGNSNLVTFHEVKLLNLDDNVKYYFKVKSRDNFGNVGESEIFNFTTSADTTPPAISEVKSEASLVGSGESSRIQIIVSWSTDEPATSMIDYDEGVGLGKTSVYTNHTTEDTTLNQSHIVIISGLKPATTYHFRVVSKDKVANTSKSTEYTVLTPPKDVSTLQLILKSWEETFAWVQNLKKVIPLWPF